VDAKNIDPETFDLSVKNPNGNEEIKHRSPKEIMKELPRWTLKARKYWGTSKRCYEEGMADKESW